MLKHRLLLKKWCWWILSILSILLIFFYYNMLSHLFIDPTLLLSENIHAPVLLDTDTFASTDFSNKAFVSTFDLGTSTFTNDLGELIHYPIQGTLGVPSDRDHSLPIVFIFPGYKENFFLGTERLDIGFTYLVQELASNGYLTVSLNIPPNYLLGHDSQEINRRIEELFTSHFHYLNRALTGENVGYGLDITGLGDLSNVSFISHSLSAQSLYALADSYANSDEFNLSSLLFIAPSYLPSAEVPFTSVPTSIIIPELDGTISSLDGQALYDDLTHLEVPPTLTSLVYLYGANHNAFNSLIEFDDSLNLNQELLPKSKLTTHNQRDFVTHYSIDFFNSIIEDERLDIGLQANALAPSQLYGYKVLTSLHSPNELSIFAPTGKHSESFNTLGGDIKLKNTALTYVIDSYLPTKDTAGAFFLPGNPFEFPLLRLSWNVPSGVISTIIPPKYKDVSSFESLSLSIGVDPTNSLNLPDTPQSFILEFKDTSGKAQRVLIDPSVSSMNYPSGMLISNVFTSYWSSFTPLSSLRIPLNLLDRIDLTNLYSISFIFNQTPSGSLMLGDMSFINNFE
ncbi:MAG: hypothetical protein RSD26_09550 [Cellulosilyticaceae bacterium]